MFSWLTKRIKAAILSGVTEALEEMQSAREGKDGELLLLADRRDEDDKPRSKSK